MVSRVAFSILLLLVVSASAAPQTAPSSSEEEEQLPVYREEVLVRARGPASPVAAVTVIDRETIESSQARTATELLEYVAGVYVLESGSRAGSSSAQIRGGDPNFTLVLLDGVPLNDSTDVEGGAVNLESLPATSIERIEVARGPLSYFYGSSALGGIINIVTRRRTGERARLSLDAGDASFFRATAATSGTAGRSDYYEGAGWEQESERDADEAYDQLNLQGTVTVPVGEKAYLRVASRASWWNTDDYPEASGGPIYGSGEVRHSENQEWSLGADLALPSAGRFEHRATAALYHHDLDRDSPGVLPQVPPSIEGTSFLRARFGWLTSVELGSRAQWSAGIDVEREDGSNESVLLLPPEFGGEVPGDYDFSRTTPGAFSELVLERGRLLAELGLRADFPQDQAVEWSPRVGARYRIGSGGSFLRGSLSRAFKLPSFFVLGSPPALGGNPDLRSESSWGGDLALEHRGPARDLSLSIGIFFNRFHDLIDFDFDSFTHVNRSRVDTRGIELTAGIRPSDALEISSNLTWQKVDDPASESPPLHQPVWNAGVRVSFSPVTPLNLRGEGRFVSSSFDRQLTAPDIESVDGYVVWDFITTWRLSDRFEVRGRIDNIGNESYQVFVGFPEPGRSAWAGLQLTLR
jgi:outer membrane cobalamin receptor